MRPRPLPSVNRRPKQTVMAGRLAGQNAGRSLHGAHRALVEAKAALEAAPRNSHSADALKAIARALRDVAEATACTDHMSGRIR